MKIAGYPRKYPDSNCIALRRCTPEELDEMRILAHPEWGIPHDTINVPNPAHFKCKTFNVDCIIKKETNDYWEVIELFNSYTRYYKQRGLF